MCSSDLGAIQGFKIVGHALEEAIGRSRTAASHVGGRDQDGSHECVILGGGVGDNPASHAVSGEDDATSIDAEHFGVVAKVSEHGLRVFEILREAKARLFAA